MSEYRFYLDDGTDITNHFGSPELTDSTDTLAMSLSFEWIAEGYMLENGDKIIVTDDGERIFNGIVTTISYEMNQRYSVIAYDYAFYMNKSEITIQFINICADQAIQQLCNKVGVPIGSICSIKTTISKIYYGETPSYILKDILNAAYDETGKNYRFEMRNNALYVDDIRTLKIDLSDELKYAEISGQKSIEDMKNSIVVMVQDDTNYIYCRTEDSESISKYGLLQHVEKISSDDISKARNTMNVLKYNLNRIQENYSISLPIKKECRSGRVFDLKYDDFQLEGTYMITSCKKKLYGDYYMTLEVGLIEAKMGVS